MLAENVVIRAPQKEPFVCDRHGRLVKRGQWRNVCRICRMVLCDYCAMSHADREHRNEMQERP